MFQLKNSEGNVAQLILDANPMSLEPTSSSTGLFTYVTSSRSVNIFSRSLKCCEELWGPKPSIFSLSRQFDIRYNTLELCIYAYVIRRADWNRNYGVRRALFEEESLVYQNNLSNVPVQDKSNIYILLITFRNVILYNYSQAVWLIYLWFIVI